MSSIFDLLDILVPVYIERMQEGFSASDAAQFGSSRDIHNRYLSEAQFDIVDSACVELARLLLADVLMMDGRVYRFELRKSAESYWKQINPSKVS